MKSQKEHCIFKSVNQKNFVNRLSQEVGMKMAPSTVLDLTLGHLFRSYRHYYMLPKDHVSGLDMIYGVLVNDAQLYTAKYGKIPVLCIQCIDGVDLLARRNSEMYDALITLVKVLANSKKLKLVLVSSKGAIMPYLENCQLPTGHMCMKSGTLMRRMQFYF